jgi:L-fuconolactonase
MKRRLFLKSGLSAGLGTILVPEYALPRISSVLEDDIPIIDTHMHLWDLQKMHYPWLENQRAPLNKNFLVSDYQQATRNIPIKKMVFVESARLESQYLEEVDWVVDLAKIEPKIQGIVAYLPIEKGQDVTPQIEILLERKLVKGIRHGVNKELLGDSKFQTGLQLLSRYQLSFDLNITTTQIPGAIKLIRQCPDTVFILDHLGNPNIKDQELSIWKSHMKELAEMNNVSCKISGLITKADLLSWKHEDIRPYILHALETFGPKRLMFGSDWPVVLRAGSYQDWFLTLQMVLEELSPEEKMQVFYNTAEKVYRLK